VLSSLYASKPEDNEGLGLKECKMLLCGTLVYFTTILQRMNNISTTYHSLVGLPTYVLLIKKRQARSPKVLAFCVCG
jgi:hypothetical protein